MKKFLLSMCCLAAVSSSSLAESALSARGFGLQYETSSARSAAMGLAGLSSADSLSLDLTSPANWAGPRTARFGFSSFTVRETVADNSGTDIGDNGGVGGVGLAMAVGKTAFVGFTITPVTMMDYRWSTAGTSPWSTTLTRRVGQGGLSQGLIAGSMQVNDGLRLGLALRPIFGKVERLWKIDYPEGGGFSASQTISDRFSGYGVSISGRWQLPDSSRFSGWSLGLLLNTPISLNVQRQVFIGEGGGAQIDSTFELNEKYDLPLDLGLGIAKQYGRHLIAVDAMIHNWGAVDPPRIEGGTFENSYRLSGGWEWSPEHRPLDPFWQRWIYRAGFYSSNTYGVSATGNQAGRLALTSGLGIPYAKGKSRLDLAVEFGWAGDKGEDGAEERTIGVTVGFNHSEQWFVGRRGR